MDYMDSGLRYTPKTVRQGYTHLYTRTHTHTETAKLLFLVKLSEPDCFCFRVTQMIFVCFGTELFIRQLFIISKFSFVLY